jgi:hypothetical protein
LENSKIPKNTIKGVYRASRWYQKVLVDAEMFGEVGWPVLLISHLQLNSRDIVTLMFLVKTIYSRLVIAGALTQAFPPMGGLGGYGPMISR